MLSVTDNKELEEKVEILDKKPPAPVPPPRSSSVKDFKVSQQNSLDSPSKIDIHVTVTVNPFSPGTLSDLKKQRALSRASQSSYTLNGSSNVISVQTPEIEPEEQASDNSLAVKPYPVPPSPSAPPKRYAGEPADLVEKTTGWLCCCVM